MGPYKGKWGMKLEINLKVCLKLLGLESFIELVEAKEKEINLENGNFTVEKAEVIGKICSQKEKEKPIMINCNYKLIIKKNIKKISIHYIRQETTPFSYFDDLGYSYEKNRTDIIGEFFVEDDIMFYEVGETSQQMIETELEGNYGSIKEIRTLNDIEDDNKKVQILELEDPATENKILLMK